MKYKYSICICNYNMQDTITKSLTSILEQLNKNFEVVIVDDGSSDNSVKILKKMEKQYLNLTVIPLKRDKKRKLGMTRNISIQKATGEYVLLHLDCDDIYEPYIIDFTKVFHQIEEAMGKDILLSGQHINMGKRKFLLHYGPYRNIFRGEDRDMWIRIAAIDAYIPLEHIDFVDRIPKNNRNRIKSSFIHTWDHMIHDFRTGITLLDYYRRHIGRDAKNTRTVRFLRLLYLFPAYFTSKLKKALPLPDKINTPELFNTYRKNNNGCFSELLNRYNKKPDYSQLSKNAKKIFF